MPVPKIVLLLLLFCSPACFGQNITLRGKVADANGTPLESATVYLSNVKDSIVLAYTITDKKGEWDIKTGRLKAPALLKIAYQGLAPYRQELLPATGDMDFGLLTLEELPTEIGEVVIEAEAPPIRVKKDTLEFNASSFKVRPDANVEALIKRLPGVSIDAEGVISFNGKPVNQILVDGKPFFDTDGTIALKNLPADIIDKIQVTDLKTRQEELTGQKARGDDASINLTLKKDKNKGVFGTLTGGYGTNSRYEAGIFGNYFNNKRKISVTASSNNINTSGFAMNDVFGSMGSRGSGRVRMTGGTGRLGVGNGGGISISGTVGLNYADEPFKDLETTGGYTYSISNNENRNRNSTTNYLTEEDSLNPGQLIDKSYLNTSSSSSKGENVSHDFTGDFRFKADSLTNFNYMPRFNVSENSSNSSSQSSSQRVADGTLLNESDSQSFSRGTSHSFNGTFNFYRKSARRKGRGLSAMLTHNNQANTGQNRNISNTVSYTYNGGNTQGETDNRNQVLDNDNSTNSYNFKLQYFEPVTDSLRLTVGVALSNSKTANVRNSYDLDPVGGAYSIFNDSLSNNLAGNTASAIPELGLVLDKKRFSLNLSGGVNISSFKNRALYVGERYSFDKTYILPSANINASYKFEKWKSVNFNYNYMANFPQAREVLPVIDRSNPLNTVTGNPGLNPTASHTFRASLRNFDNGRQAGYSFSGNATFFGNQVVQYRYIDESAKTVTSYRNISGAVNTSISANYNKMVKKEAHTFNVNLNLFLSYSTNKGFLNRELYNSKAVFLSPNVYISYDYGELLTIAPSYSFNYNVYNYSNYSVNAASSFLHRFSLETTSYWPQHLVFGNDVSYSYNPDIAGGFKKDFLFWNTSIGYNFLEDRLLLKVKVYDVLNQNTGTQRTMSPTSISDNESLVLKRYVMFSLSYKIKQFGGRKEKRND